LRVEGSGFGIYYSGVRVRRVKLSSLGLRV
jgi:hypothetical protein